MHILPDLHLPLHLHLHAHVHLHPHLPLTLATYSYYTHCTHATCCTEQAVALSLYASRRDMLQVACCRICLHLVHAVRIPNACYLLPATCCLLPATHSTTYHRLPTSDRLVIATYYLPTANCYLLPTTYHLPPAACSLRSVTPSSCPTRL